MANVQHSSLTGAELHEPKGADSASSGEVYVSDGAGSGAWGLAETLGATKDVAGTDGYVKLPGGVILQWGSGTSPSSGGIATVTFSTAFTTACFYADARKINPTDTGGSDADASLRSASTTGASFSIPNNTQYQWIAIGY